MEFLKINIKIFFFYWILFCLTIFSINIPILGSFRILDISLLFLLGLFLLTNPKINKQQFFLFILIIISFLISSLIGFYRKGFIEIDKLGFIYKYLFIFTVPWLVIEIVKTEKQIRIINLLLLIKFILLSSWSWIYVYLHDLDFIQGHRRASFPFNNFDVTDGHLFSAYLGFFLGAYLLYLKNFFKHKLLFSISITSNAIIGLIMTGSRSGMFVVGIIFIFFIISKLIIFFKFVYTSKLSLKKKYKDKFIYNLISLVLLIIFLYHFAFNFVAKYDYLFERTTNFNLYNDQSFLSRINKLQLAIDETKFSGWLFGNGLNADLLWYDGLFSILLAHGGLIFIFFIFIFYYFLIKKKTLSNLNENFLKFKYLFFLYLLSNVITEYVFVSRNSFPVLIMLSILYLNSSNKKFINLRH